MKSPRHAHTLRSDGGTPKTSDCLTPRTLNGIDGAFKDECYGGVLQGPYRNLGRRATFAFWIITAALAVLTTVLLVAFDA